MTVRNLELDRHIVVMYHIGKTPSNGTIIFDHESYSAIVLLFDNLNLCQGRRQRGGSGARPPHLKSVLPNARLAPRLLHTSNTVF